MKLFVGIDWGSRVHSGCVVDGSGQVVTEWEFEHSAEGISGCIDRLLKLAEQDAGRLRVAIEMPHGAVVEGLVERGIEVLSINPKQLDRFRDRHSVAGAKDDARDAYVLADSLRTDTKLYRPVRLAPAALVELGDMSRMYDDLTAQVVALGNQVQQQLQRYYVQLRDLGRWHEEPWLWDLFDQAPTPQKLETLRQSEIKAILKEHRIRRFKPLPLLEKLQEQRALFVAPGVAEGASGRIAATLRILRATHDERKACLSRIERLLKEASKKEEGDETHRDAELLLSLPGLGKRNGAAMLTEARVALQDRDYQALRRLSGTAPVSKRTGGRKKAPMVVMRRACNPRLRNAVYHWARVASQSNARARAHYGRLRAKGHGHARALRGVADRLLKMLVAILSSGKLYDSTLHQERSENGARTLAPPSAATACG